ncbi:phage holin family protein [Qingshengfaniella alkalisoli]|uniref:Phage holin family protein n=1 Tax=Qingshengfaniella alkalisoli TaxID=2599296 RepID=A0A5B8IWN3_9RHOB|nr:phage holin family protein [Qingshengfaniella alkalisoli]QDY70084.1 hypothetical protein FPZ52_10945 [Qingshengfaniella alkalisoli]
MLKAIEQLLSRAAANAALALLAGASVTVGIAFLTVAAWIALASHYDTLVAALVIGCAYVALSAILFAALKTSGRHSPPPEYRAPPPPPPQSDIVSLVEAFFSGFDAARRRNRRR